MNNISNKEPKDIEKIINIAEKYGNKSIFTLSVFMLILCFNFSLLAYEEADAIKMLKTFYTEYIKETSEYGEGYNPKKIEALKQKYCTTNFLKKLKAMNSDYDIFLNAQDSDISYVKTLNVTKDQNNIYIVSYKFRNEIIKKIYLVLKDEKTGLKIDNITAYENINMD